MRILEAIHAIDLRLGGPCRAVLDLSEVMAARGHDISILTAAGPSIPPDWLLSSTTREAGHPVARLCSDFSWPFPRKMFLRQAEALVSESDVVHLHGVWEPFNLVVASVAQRTGVPYVITLRGMLDDWSMIKSRYKKRLYLAVGGRRMLEQAAFVQCTAEAELRQSRKWFPRGRGCVVPNLLNLTPFNDHVDESHALRAFPAVAGYGVRLLFLGRISPKKGVEHLLESVAELRRRKIDVCAIIAGDPADAKYAGLLKGLVRQREIEDRVFFVGHLSGTLKHSLLQAATLTVIPTSQENFGFVFFESLAAGTPVITTDLIDTADELASSGAGFLVPQSGEAIASCVQRLVSDAPALAVAGQQGRSWVHRELATERVAAKYDELFSAAAQRGAGGAK